jgi:hypothetical protein
VKFFFILMGDVVGKPIPFDGQINYAVMTVGIVLFLIAVGSVASYGVRRDIDGGNPIGVALICFGLLFALLVTIGRVTFGYWEATSSRYATFTLLIPIGIYLTLLGRPVSTRHSGCLNSHMAELSGTPKHRIVAEPSGSLKRFVLPACCWGLGVVIALQIAFGAYYGIEGAGTFNAYQLQAARVLRNIDKASDQLVVTSLALGEPASFLRHEAQILKQHHLSLFSDSTSP